GRALAVSSCQCMRVVRSRWPRQPGGLDAVEAIPPTACRVRGSNGVQGVACGRSGTADAPAISDRSGFGGDVRARARGPRECEAIEEAPTYQTERGGSRSPRTRG